MIFTSFLLGRNLTPACRQGRVSSQRFSLIGVAKGSRSVHTFATDLYVFPCCMVDVMSVFMVVVFTMTIVLHQKDMR